MNKLVFENSLGQTVEFSGDSKYKLKTVDGLGGLTSKFQTTASPFQDGVTSVDDGFFQSDTVAIVFTIMSSDIIADIRELNSVMNPKLGSGKLKYYTGEFVRVLHGVKTRVLPEILTGKANRGVTFQASSVILERFDPYFQDDAETVSVVASQYDNFVFDLAITDDFTFDQSGASGISVVNYGDVEAPITVVMDGPLTSPIVVQNNTTGEKIVVSMSIAAGDRLVITTDVENIDVRKVVIATGVETSGFQYIDVAQTTFFGLARGSNTLSFTHGVELAEEVVVKHRNKYVGV